MRDLEDMDRRIRLLHFADAHIDIANYGRYDPETGLPVRVLDFLRALDQIVDTAIAQKVDLVIFAGDAYKDRNPQPTFQREWGQRIMRLSEAGIPTLLLVGNHDVAPAVGRANTVQEFKTLNVPHIHVADQIRPFGPDELGIPAQIVTVPWLSHSRFMAMAGITGKSRADILAEAEDLIAAEVQKLLDAALPDLPLILAAHASVQGAVYPGSERAIMLGHELVLSGGIVRHPRLDYVALGHIHKHQSLNDDRHPPIIYPGSIERIDFGEAREGKGFVLAEVGRGDASWNFVELETTRRFLDFKIELGRSADEADSFMADLMAQLPLPEEAAGAVCRLQLYYPQEWEALVDEQAINAHFSAAFSFQLQKHRRVEKRARLGDTVAVESLSPLELLEQYWQTVGLAEEETVAMQQLAQELIATSGQEDN